MILDLEILLVKNLNWSLRDIDETDCDSLFDFIYRYSHNARESEPQQGGRRKYCDEVNFL